MLLFIEIYNWHSVCCQVVAKLPDTLKIPMQLRPNGGTLLEEKTTVTRRLPGALFACILSISVSPASAARIDYAATSGGNILLDATDGCGTAGIIGCFSFTPNAASSPTATSLGEPNEQ